MLQLSTCTQWPEDRSGSSPEWMGTTLEGMEELVSAQVSPQGMCGVIHSMPHTEMHVHGNGDHRSEKYQFQTRSPPGLHIQICTLPRPWSIDISSSFTALKVLNHNSQSWILFYLNKATYRFLHRKRERAMTAQLESAQTKSSETDHWVCSHPASEAAQDLSWKWKPLLFCEFQAQWTHNWTKKAKANPILELSKGSCWIHYHQMSFLIQFIELAFVGYLLCVLVQEMV